MVALPPVRTEANVQISKSVLLNRQYRTSGIVPSLDVLLGLSWVHHRVDIRDLVHARVDVAAGIYWPGHDAKVRV
jgi:hypothetical protein